MIALGILEIFLSQIPNFHKLSWLSILAAVMSFGYAGIGIGLSITMIISGNAHLSFFPPIFFWYSYLFIFIFIFSKSRQVFYYNNLHNREKKISEISFKSI